MILCGAVVLSVLMHAARSAPIQCNVTKFDEAAGHIIFFASGTTLPTTSDGFDKMCNDHALGALDVANQYVDNCINGLAKGMLKLLMEGASKEIRTKCTKGDKGREEYLRLADCLIPKAGENLYRCNRHLSGIFEATLVKPKRDRVPLSCCYMGEYYQCIRKATTVCGPDAQRFAKEVVDSYAGDIMESVCASLHPESSRCKALPKLKAVQPPRFRTLAPSLAEVLASLSK